MHFLLKKTGLERKSSSIDFYQPYVLTLNDLLSVVLKRINKDADCKNGSH